jgi:hypothetical protein
MVPQRYVENQKFPQSYAIFAEAGDKNKNKILLLQAISHLDSSARYWESIAAG